MFFRRSSFLPFALEVVALHGRTLWYVIGGDAIVWLAQQHVWGQFTARNRNVRRQVCSQNGQHLFCQDFLPY